jgi:lysozyme
MRTNALGIALIKKFESLHDGDLTLIGLQPKMDSIGIWTEGWGRAMRDKDGNFLRGPQKKDVAFARRTIRTVEEADQALAYDLTAFELAVSRAIKVPLTSNQFSALVSMWYNTGGSQTLANLINAKNHPSVITKWWQTHYISAGGKVLNGLIRRRLEESQLFLKA